jgi:aldehyde dehydrogenase (NAD+)
MAKKWELSPAPESTAHVQLKEKYQLFINGAWQKPASKKYFKTVNPSNHKTLAEVAAAGKSDVDAAFQAADQAFEKWSKLPGAERGKYIYRIARMIQERSREFAVLESMDGGKPIRESRDIDVPLAAAHFFYYAGWADKLDYAFPNRKVKPLGVAAQIIPWNFPLLMAAWKIAPALACGNTVVIKPAETTPLTALLLAEVIAESGLPPGVVNVITGDGSTGEWMTAHPVPQKLAFTGSTEVGKLIYSAAIRGNKRVTLELGGKAANIIFDDAPIEAAVEGIINGIYFNQGHVCCAGSRLFVQEGVYEEVLRKLKSRMDQLVVGDPLDKNTDIGAINSKAQLETIQGYIQIGIDEGAEIYQPEMKVPATGNWCKPTLFTNVAQSHRISQEEIFGPVLAIQTFRTIDEVIEKANNTPYGLSAGVWTDKGSKIFQLTTALKAGVIWANTYNKFDPTSPFGGFKESGFGREGGVHGLEAYLELMPK